MPAAPSWDILGSLRASGAVMRHDDEQKAAFPCVVPMLFQRWEWGLELVDGHGLAGSEAEAVDVNFARGGNHAQVAIDAPHIVAGRIDERNAMRAVGGDRVTLDEGGIVFHIGAQANHDPLVRSRL